MSNNLKVLLKFCIPAIICVIVLLGSSELEYKQVITTVAANVVTACSMVVAILYWLYEYFKQK